MCCGSIPASRPLSSGLFLWARYGRSCWSDANRRRHREDHGDPSAPVGKARCTIELCPARRAGTPEEIGSVGAPLMGTGGAFITGSGFPIDGSVTAAYWYGEPAPKRRLGMADSAAS